MAPPKEKDASPKQVSDSEGSPLESVNTEWSVVSPNTERVVAFPENSFAPSTMPKKVRPGFLSRTSSIVWNVPFGAPDTSPRSPGSLRTPGSPLARTRTPSSPGGRRVSAIRRMSAAVAAVGNTLDTLQQHPGNPLGLGINEERRISSAGYKTRKQSLAPAGLGIDTLPTIEDEKVWEDIPEENLVHHDGEDYVITRLAKYDDIETLSKGKRFFHRFSPILVLASIIAYWIYFVLRLRLTIVAQNKANTIYGMAWAFIVVEFGVAFPMMLHRFWCLHATGLRRRPKLRIVGDNVPTVDVVITCCKEDDSQVLNTALAACNVDWPRDRFRVIVCDDGQSTQLRNMIQTAAYKHPNLYYRSRPKIPWVFHHFKAGNLNYALEQTDLLPGHGADFFAALDADMIPERDWLRALIPHMLQNLNCAMACPPQLFYNVPIDDPLCQSLNVFAHISEPIKDSLGVAWCTGSGYVVRRKALRQVGGFPTGSLAEDVCCSSMLLGVGAETAYVHEPLQYGTVPDSLDSHLKQRTRWTIGTIQTSLKLRFCVWGPLVRHMTAIQRVCGFVYTVGGLFTIFLCISMVTIPIVLFSGGNMIPYTTESDLRWLIRSSWASLILNRINEFIAYIPCGYHVGQRELRAMMWSAPYHTIAVVQSFLLPSWLGGKVAVFTSSGSQKADLNERDAHLRAPILRRVIHTLYHGRAWMHLLYVLFILASIIVATYWNLSDPITIKYANLQRWQRVLTHAGWPPLVWLTCTISCSIPIKYAIFPPTMPPREELLVREEDSEVAYPSAWAKEEKSSWMTYLHEVQYSLLTIYATGVFAWSFYT